mmetsp:Transcript_55479/g.108630  ORF Transcript_55479/g.108630 Transcript_55479/m.108630 type:complete len:380 (-) Transcript_55479:1495-2634(-)
MIPKATPPVREPSSPAAPHGPRRKIHSASRLDPLPLVQLLPDGEPPEVLAAESLSLLGLDKVEEEELVLINECQLLGLRQSADLGGVGERALVPLAAFAECVEESAGKIAYVVTEDTKVALLAPSSDVLAHLHLKAKKTNQSKKKPCSHVTYRYRRNAPQLTSGSCQNKRTNKKGIAREREINVCGVSPCCNVFLFFRALSFDFPFSVSNTSIFLISDSFLVKNLAPFRLDTFFFFIIGLTVAFFFVLVFSYIHLLIPFLRFHFILFYSIIHSFTHSSTHFTYPLPSIHSIHLLALYHDRIVRKAAPLSNTTPARSVGHSFTFFFFRGPLQISSSSLTHARVTPIHVLPSCPARSSDCLIGSSVSLPFLLLLRRTGKKE